MTQTALSIDFLRAYAQLPRKAQRKADAFVQKFREDPTASALNYEHIRQARDQRLRSARVGDDYRVILRAPEQGDVYILLWVDHHDEAYRWAKNKQTDVHPMTGTLQVFDVPNLPPSPAIEPAAEADLPSAPDAAAIGAFGDEAPEILPGLFEDYSDEQLFQGGVPLALMPAVRAVRSDEQLERLLPHLPEEAGEVVTGLAAGLELDAVLEEVLGRAPTAPVAPVDPPKVDTADVAAALARETSQRKFRVLDGEFDLDAALRWPLDAWRVFLHPAQRSIARARTKGPMRVLGAAGTGKTVVALHRAAFLAQSIFNQPQDRILLTTFTRNLASDLRSMLDKLLSEPARSRVEIVNLDAWAASMLSRDGANLRLAGEQDRSRAWNRAIDLYGEDGIRREFYISEWEDVVLEQNLRSEEEYVRCRRLRRGTRLSRGERRRLWPVFERYRTELDERGVAEPVDILREARRRVEAAAGGTRYAAVIVDEAQDFSSEGLRLIRALAGAEHGDDLFLVGDAHQRIYGRPVSLSACGINVRGRRSRYLRLNYRTTAAISRWSLTTLRGEHFDDLDDGSVDLRGYTSLREGQPPQVSHFESGSDEQRYVVAEIQSALKNGLPPESLCLTARTHSQLRSSYGPVLEAAGIPYEEIGPDEPAPGRVRLATMHRIKGLEFSMVIVAGVNEGMMPLRTPNLGSEDPVVARLALLRERCLLYVAASRARDRLVVTSYGKRSRFLDVAAASLTPSTTASAPPSRRLSTPAPPSVAPLGGPRASESGAEQASAADPADQLITDLPFPTRIINWAAQKRILTLRDLVAWHPNALVRERNVGRGSVAETRKLLEDQLGTSWEAARAAMAPASGQADLAADVATEPARWRWDDLRNALRPSILDTPLGEVELPTRLANFAAAQGMKTVRELVARESVDLVATKNLGRTSVRKGREALVAYITELDTADATFERGFLELWKEQLSSLEALPRMVISNRSGLAGRTQTLQALGEMLGVSRERIRQIEATSIERLRTRRRWVDHMTSRLDAALVGGAVHVAELDTEPWWAGVESRVATLSFFCDRVLDGKFSVVGIDDDVLVAKVSQKDVDAAWQQLRSDASQVEVPAPESDVLALLEPLKDQLGEVLTQRLWERLEQELILDDGPTGERRVLAVGDTKAAQVLAYLRSCDQPVSVHDVYERFGRVRFPDSVLFFKRGLIGLEQHFPDFPQWQARLVPKAAELMRDLGPERQWSVPELHDELCDLEALPDWLGHWHLASLLRQSSEVTYLGRLRVALPGVADDTGRLKLKTALQDILRAEGQPLERKALFEQARKLTGTPEATLSLAVLTLPFVRLTNDTVGLLERDLVGGADAVLKVTERIQSWLIERSEGATSHELRQVLTAWNEAGASWSEEAILSVLRSDPRFRLSRAGNVGLSEWDSVRVPSKLKLVEQVLRTGAERVAVDSIQTAIAERYGAPLDRNTLNSMVNRFGAGLDGEWAVVSA